jgi:hypothetical protein
MATSYTKAEFEAAMDAQLEGIVRTFRDTVVRRNVGADGTVMTPRLSRAEILKTLARRALRKTTQSTMRAETRVSSTTGVNPLDDYS